MPCAWIEDGKRYSGQKPDEGHFSNSDLDYCVLASDWTALLGLLVLIAKNFLVQHHFAPLQDSVEPCLFSILLKLYFHFHLFCIPGLSLRPYFSSGWVGLYIFIYFFSASFPHPSYSGYWSNEAKRCSASVLIHFPTYWAHTHTRTHTHTKIYLYISTLYYIFTYKYVDIHLLKKSAY